MERRSIPHVYIEEQPLISIYLKFISVPKSRKILHTLSVILLYSTQFHILKKLREALGKRTTQRSPAR